MRCRMVKTLLPLHIAGALRPEVAEQVDQHLLTCAACRMIAAELRVNQPKANETVPSPALGQAPPISRPIQAYRRHADTAKARAEVASTTAATPSQAQPAMERVVTEKVMPGLPRASTREDRHPVPPGDAARAAGAARTDHHAWHTPRAPRPAIATPLPAKAIAHKLFTALMVALALALGLAWRGAGLRLEAYRQEVMAGAIAELQADLKRIEVQIQSPADPIVFPPLSKERLAMGLLLKADPLYQENYLALVEAYGQLQSAVALWRSEQSSAPESIISGFAGEVNKAVQEAIATLEPFKAGWPPSSEQRVAVKQAAARLQGLALSYIDEGTVPGYAPEAKVSQQAAIDSATALLMPGAQAVTPAAVRHYQRRQGIDLWEISFTHNLQKWQVQINADSGQLMGMILPIPNKGDQVTLEQAEQTARSYLAERVQADRFAMIDRQEKDGQVLYTALRVVGGLRYFSDPLKVGVARYGGMITYYQRLQPATAWPDVPIYQLTAEQAGERAAAWAAAQKVAGPGDEGTLGVVRHPNRQERLVWGFATGEPGVQIYVDAQTGETWR